MSDSPTPRVLLVDDSKLIRRLVMTFLRAAGYELDEAAGGQEAQVRLEQFDYDLVILDIMMPGMTGLQLARIM